MQGGNGSIQTQKALQSSTERIMGQHLIVFNGVLLLQYKQLLDQTNRKIKVDMIIDTKLTVKEHI